MKIRMTKTLILEGRILCENNEYDIIQYHQFGDRHRIVITNKVWSMVMPLAKIKNYISKEDMCWIKLKGPFVDENQND